ncbi:winged helix-turn-helix domain-containing protein [Pseudoruegeria sp. SK021]|uniref:winged helix-turn-helix domain-containing protein n=1 Tax=Pseudoruegeria sp. SK021 TaxID=1933035 RepID=UPI000A265787|nr:winged helix-turn-helix domain-containing protein [Pseudoruegeria sp. SK021]OSP56122.1 hypothetical protein BV911_04070 [Pseudoruegeria sp. SK021]
MSDVLPSVPPHPDTPRLRLRLVFPDGGMLGPGKIDLLGLILAHGSISAAGREMRMSYKRAWQLVDDMNAAFREPLVESTRGGPKGGGARLTQTGQRVLTIYRDLERQTQQAGAPQITALTAMRSDIAGQK